MDLNEFKLYSIGIEKEIFGKIYSFIDFGNVDYWYEKDERDCEGNLLSKNEKLSISIEKLASFSHLFSEHSRFYFGFDPQNTKSVGFLDKSRDFFDKTVTKPIQNIKHYIGSLEMIANTRKVDRDEKGYFVHVPKCNFDVEICVDAIRLVEKYDTICLFSGDADFVRLIYFLKKKNKKIILVKGGYIQHDLRDAVDLVINAQDIKSLVAFKKQKSRP